MSGDTDFEIHVGQATPRYAVKKKSPQQDPKLCAVPYGDPGAEQVPVFIAERVMRAVEKQTLAHREKEVGGVLLGDCYSTDSGKYVEITGFIEATAAQGTDTSLTFTHETWEHITAEQYARGDEARMVGWYHSHPGLGVFMSREDNFIHSSYFQEPWQVALVVDPVHHNWGCFRWMDGSLERTGGFYIYGPKKSARGIRKYAEEVTSKRQSGPRFAAPTVELREFALTPGNLALWAIVVLLLVSQIATWILKAPKSGEKKPDVQVVELLEAGNLTGAEEYFRDNLDMGAIHHLQSLERVFLKTQEFRERHETLDRANARLALADKLATVVVLAPKPSLWERLTGKETDFFTGADKAALLGAAIDIYESEEATRGARLERARIALYASRPESETANTAHNGNTAYRSAFNRVANEKYRLAAYKYALAGLQSGADESELKELRADYHNFVADAKKDAGLKYVKPYMDQTVGRVKSGDPEGGSN